jgi:hypothetical protein
MEGSILSFIDPSATTTTTTTTTEQVNNFPPAIEQKLKQTAEKTAALVEQLRQLDQHLSESSRYKKNLTSGRVAMAIDAEERMAEMMAEYGEISSNDVTMLFE